MHTGVDLEELQDLCEAALRSLAYSQAEAEIVTQALLYAQLRGNNQNLIKITTGALARASDAGAGHILHQSPSSALIDGQQRLGMVVVEQATRLAVDKALNTGFGLVGINNISSSTGALGYWAEEIAKQGLVALVLAQSPEYVAPHGSTQAIFGTNPIAVGVPATGGPLVMDMATSAYAWYGLLEAKHAGRSVPDDVGFDAQGNPTTNPAAILDGGAIRAFDRSYKGSHLALIVELLGGALVGGAVSDKLAQRNWGTLVVAINPSLLGTQHSLPQTAQELLDRVKGARRAPRVEEILLPGERGNRLAAKHRAEGRVTVETAVLEEIRRMASTAPASEPHGPSSHNGTPAGNSSQPATSSRSAEASAASTSAPESVVDLPGSGTVGTQPRQLGGTPSIATRLLHPPKVTTDPYGAMSSPIYQTATFDQPSATANGPYDYTRSGNPTRALLEAQMADLEGADRAFAFASGMAALAAVVRLVKSGEHIVAGDDIYGGTSRLLAQVVPACGVEVTNVDTTDIRAVEAAILPGRTKLVMLESPTNPRMQICDIKALVDIAHKHGALVVVDNSIMAPVFQQPIGLGADISMTSATKFIGGHSDVTGGILSVKGEELAKRIYFLQNAEGAGLGPQDCWLCLRGLKTMSLRMERQADNCAIIADYLAQHPLVKKINYPGLRAHRGHHIHIRQATHGGSLLSFETGNVEASKVIVEEAQLFKITVSFGSVTSLVSLPCYMSHASIPAEVRAARGLPDDLVRISVGVEDAADLVADLDQAMQKAMKKIGMDAGASRAFAVNLASQRERQLQARVAHLEALGVAHT
ncbi:hypothetical protein WJX72_005673 [[Myrmecia] bisecta]|uniref:cysteine-S-conjugate beta-lyase n=1 Tax=[Myrmecia] bisecta TaxID=41462 RepID=A0AAW1R6N1_9CHLO